MLWPSPPWEGVTYWALDLETGGSMRVRSDPRGRDGADPRRRDPARRGLRVARPPRGGRASGRPRSARTTWCRRTCARRRRSRRSSPTIDGRLREGALLVHHAALDVRFLRQAYKREAMRWPDPPVVDTVALLLKAARRARFVDPDASEHEPELNLAAARRRLGLPDYGTHDALTDAVAAAELFLVLRRQVGAKRLRDVSVRLAIWQRVRREQRRDQERHRDGAIDPLVRSIAAGRGRARAWHEGSG